MARKSGLPLSRALAFFRQVDSQRRKQTLAFIRDRLSRLVPVVAPLLICSVQTSASDMPFATVKVNEPGEWRSFSVGQVIASSATGNGGSTYWRSIPESLTTPALEFYYLGEDQSKTDTIKYGKLDFELATGGRVWMLTTIRFKNSGGTDGNWLDELSTQADLETEGWRIVGRSIQTEWGYEKFGANQSFMDWLVFERIGTAGEQFSIRTEKYQSPMMLRLKASPETSGLRLRISKADPGQVKLEAIGDPGSYALQASSDLRSWVSVSEARLRFDIFQSIHRDSTSAPRRFFRLQKSPSEPTTAPQPPKPSPTPDVAPVIVTHPASFSVREGQSFSLTVAATGPGTLIYQWFVNGKPISGATAPSFSATARLDSAGSYTVMVTSGSMTTISQPGIVTVIPNPPDIARVSVAGLTVWINSPARGSFRWVAAPSGQSYVAFPDDGQDGTRGTYTYSKTAPDRGVISVVDYWDGPVSGTVTFTSANEGSIAMGNWGGPFVIETTTSAIATLAANNLAGKTVRAAIIDAEGILFSDVGGWRVVVQSSGTAYTLTGVGFIWSSTGTLNYRRVNDASSTVTLTDSLSGSINGTVTWFSPNYGELSLVHPQLGWQLCVCRID